MTTTEAPATPDGVSARAPEDPLDLHHGIGLYIHIPFCATKCTYCDFNTFAGIEPLMPAVVDALETELTLWATRGDIPEWATVFFGGGTPSYLPATDIQRLIDTASTNYGIARDAELTLEANPDDINATKLASWKQAGINRLSIGVQSFNDTILRTLSRRHSSRCRTVHHLSSGTRPARSLAASAGRTGTAGDAGSGSGCSTRATRAGSARSICRQFWWALDAAIAHTYDPRRSRLGHSTPPIDKGPLLQSAGFSSIEGQFSPPIDKDPLLQSAGFSSIEGQFSPPIDKDPLLQSAGFSSIEGQFSPPTDESPLLQSAGFSSIEGQCLPPADEGPLRSHRKPGRRRGKCSPPTDEGPLRSHRKPGRRRGQCSPPIDEGPL